MRVSAPTQRAPVMMWRWGDGGAYSLYFSVCTGGGEVMDREFPNSMTYWWPRVEDVDVPIPETRLISWSIDDYNDIINDINRLAIRGTPAIGIAGAMGVVLGIRKSKAKDSIEF